MEHYRLMEGKALGFVYRLDRVSALFERYAGGGRWVIDQDLMKHHFGMSNDYRREAIAGDLDDWLKMFDDRLAAQ
jgi:hypothetical protein